MTRRRIDQALCDRAELLARAHPLGTVAQLLGLCPSQISRMRKRGWRAADHAAMRRPAPADLAIQAHLLTFAALARHYRCGNATLLRWLRELPVRPPSRRGANLRNRGSGAAARRPLPKPDAPAAATAGVSAPQGRSSGSSARGHHRPETTLP